MQWSQNGGKCGICGDAYNAKEPRPHEAGGEFGRGIITRHYFAGQVSEIIELILKFFERTMEPSLLFRSFLHSLLTIDWVKRG